MGLHNIMAYTCRAPRLHVLRAPVAVRVCEQQCITSLSGCLWVQFRKSTAAAHMAAIFQYCHVSLKDYCDRQFSMIKLPQSCDRPTPSHYCHITIAWYISQSCDYQNNVIGLHTSVISQSCDTRLITTIMWYANTLMWYHNRVIHEWLLKLRNRPTQQATHFCDITIVWYSTHFCDITIVW